MRFEFATATRSIFGPGTLREIGGLAKELGRSALVVTGRNPERAAPLLALLREQGLTAETFPVANEPEIATVEKGVLRAREIAGDLVVSFGGGSGIDAGKAIAAMLSN